MKNNQIPSFSLLISGIIITLVIFIFLFSSGFTQNDTADSGNFPKIDIDALNPEYYVGDEFVVSGNTTLAEGEEIRILFFRDAFIHGIKVRPEKTSVEVVTEVLPGKSGNNRWSALINTTGFWPGENMVTAYSNKNWAINSTKKVLLISTDDAAPTIDDE